MSGHVSPEQAVTFKRNGRSRWAGICNSIDEAFADLTGLDSPLQAGREIRARVLKLTGIPTGVGIATTKTLAKLANAAAKKWQRQTGGVVDICNPDRRDRLLKVMPVEEVWGSGER